MSFSALIVHFLVVLNNIPLYECITGFFVGLVFFLFFFFAVVVACFCFLSIPILKDILFVPVWGDYIIQLLETFKHLCAGFCMDISSQLI